MSHIRTRLHNGILWLILDHPPLNIFTLEMLEQLSVAMHRALEQGPRLVVFMGAGERAFSAGTDVREHLDGREKEMLRAVVDNCAAFAELQARGIAPKAIADFEADMDALIAEGPKLENERIAAVAPHKDAAAAVRGEFAGLRDAMNIFSNGGPSLDPLEGSEKS